MKSICIDCRFAGTHTGLGRYTRSLLTALLQRPEEFRYVFLVRNSAESWLTALPKDRIATIVADIAQYSLREQITIPSLLAHSGADLFFSPHFTVPLRCPLPFIATIHDFILHRFPNRRSLLHQAAYRYLMHNTVTRAERLITVSTLVQREVGTYYGGFPEARTVVIREGVEPQFAPAVPEVQATIRQRYDLTRSFFLYVGNAKQHKNVPMLLKAYARYRKNMTNEVPADLVLITGGREADSLHKTPNVRILRDVPDADLPALYSAAIAFITASQAEGFCLPAAEALACGCPVIAAQGTAMDDFAGDGVLLLPPSIDMFADALKSPPTRSAPRVVGTWAEAAEKTAGVFRDYFSKL